MNNTYSVYEHKNKINGKIYIGQTSFLNVQRRWGKDGSLYKHSPYFYSAIQKYGWDNFEHIILESNLTAEEAEEAEKYYISLYHSNDMNYGYNLTSGGEKQKQFSQQTIQKMREKKLGKPLSEEHKKNISKANIGANNPNYGKHLSEETKQKIRDKKCKPVICVETNKVYKSKKEAAEAVGLKSPRSIMTALSNPQCTAGKDPITKERYHWKYYSEVRE